MLENSSLLVEFLNSCFQSEHPFAAYQLPGSEEITVCVQTDTKVEKYNCLGNLSGKEGFVFAPFDTASKLESLFIRADIKLTAQAISLENIRQVQNGRESSTVNSVATTPFVSTKELYLEQVSEMIAALQSRKLAKVILSRVEMLDGMGRDKAVASFLKLTKAYGSAFVFLTSVPGVGLWIGASPEILLMANKNGFETVALAGTQKKGNRRLEDIQWKDKDVKEQSYVSSYIENILEENGLVNYRQKGPFTVQAGNVVHLKTSYRFSEQIAFDKLSELSQALHPTPAVCGLPKSKSLSVIRKIEKHDREYYAGYLGPVEADGSVALFVNLRSMKVLENQMALFVGGGIIAASEPELEWDETCLKTQTLLNVISG